MQAVLDVNVLDPAMGSGHFLVEATEYIARFLVDLGVTPEGQHRPAPIATLQRRPDLAYWKRRVAQSCIYGVDLNPLAVELAKLSLWLITVAQGPPALLPRSPPAPGNSLVGARLADLAASTRPGAGAQARKPQAGRAKTQQAEAAGQVTLFDGGRLPAEHGLAVGSMWLIEESAAPAWRR